jgi:hypothetical protein
VAGGITAKLALFHRGTTVTDQPATAQPNRFKAEMPRIPGVNEELHPRSSALSKLSPKLILLAVAIVPVLGGVAWHLHASAGRGLPASAAAPESPADATPAADIPAPPAPLPSAPGPVATIDELAQPWSAKKFNFVRPDSHAVVPAMVIRLPGIAGEHSSAYWAFALTPPFGQCDLNYVTDTKELAARYGYSANHPMMAAPCNGSLYDPLRMGGVGDGIWVRGEVMQGPGIRPPTAIRIQVSGHTIIADRIE